MRQPISKKPVKSTSIESISSEIARKYRGGPDLYDLSSGRSRYVSAFMDVVSESNLSDKYNSRTLSAAARKVAENRWMMAMKKAGGRR